MMTLVAGAPTGRTTAPKRVLACRTVDRPTPTHRGHWNPTKASVMHSPQIGRRHRWHVMPVIRSGCR